jgi:hypothetical protein
VVSTRVAVGRAVGVGCGWLSCLGKTLSTVLKIMLAITSRLSTAMIISARPLYVRLTSNLLDRFSLTTIPGCPHANGRRGMIS